MNTRTITTIIVALVLVLLVMCVTGVMTYAGWVDTSKYESKQNWQQPYRSAQSMKIIDLTGDGQDDLFIQNQSNLSILDSSGNAVFSRDYPADLVSSMGDVNGDSVEDILAFYPSGASPSYSIISKGETLLEEQSNQMGLPSRVVLIRYSSGNQIILGDQNGLLVSVSPDGNELWRSQLSSGDIIRGLDDAFVNGEPLLVAANHDGTVALFDAQGQSAWNYLLPGGLRRLRAYDLNGDGTSEILLGGENGSFIILDAASREEKFTTSLGQAVSEIRDAEVNGDPTSREVVVGGKGGGVWVFSVDGTRIWSKTVSDKVTEIVGVDIDRDGMDEVIIGDESGEVNLFSGETGKRDSLYSSSSAIGRMDAGRLTDARQLVVANTSDVRLFSLEVRSAPALRFTPLIVGLIISLVVLLVAWFVATIPQKPALRMTLEDQSAESLQAQRRMLKESIADVDRLKASEEMTSDAYLARLKELRSQLAENESAMRKVGLVFSPETFNCPNCGGTLSIGIDRCEYCGQVVIS